MSKKNTAKTKSTKITKITVKSRSKSFFETVRKKLHITPQTARIWFRAIIALLAAFVLTFYLEWRYFRNDAGATFSFIGEHHLVWLWNVLLMFCITLFFTGLFRKPFTGIGVTWIFLIILSYINARKQDFRGQPVLPEDFMLADQTGTLTKFVDIGSIIMTVIAVLLVIGLIVIANHLTHKHYDWPRENEKWWKRHGRIVRAIMIVLAISGFVSGTSFIRNHVGGREDPIDFLNTKLIAWNQVKNYNHNGFIIGFMYNWSKFDMKVPGGYSEEKIAEIKDRTNELKDEAEVKRTETDKKDEETGEKIYGEKKLKNSLKDADYNIVVILNESFFDLDKLAGQYNISRNPSHATDHEGSPVTDDILPNWHKLQKSTASGFMYTLDYGGGTANIEFEIDTGLSDYWANTVPFVDLVPRVNQMPSIASFAKENGYKTLAIHPFNGGMYKRNISLQKEGFDKFITESEMDFTQHDSHRQYINDRSAYKQVMKELKDSKKKMMISLITMQNHSGYALDNYDYLNYQLNNPDATEEEKITIETYAQTVHLSDKYLGEFIDELSKSDEKTVVLFYGDHAPGIVSRANDSEDKAVRDLSRVTPYFIWANFEAEGVDLGSYINKLPMTTPNCLVNTLYNIYNLEKPDYYYLVDEVCKETPVLTQAYYGDSAPFQSTALSEYELVTYDILGGKQYWYK